MAHYTGKGWGFILARDGAIYWQGMGLYTGKAWGFILARDGALYWQGIGLGLYTGKVRDGTGAL